jgi:hypothetical protein
MVVSVEAGEEGTQALRTTRRFVRVGPLAHQSDLTANSQGLLKSQFALNLDRRTSSSSAYSRRIFDRIPLLPRHTSTWLILLTMRDTFLRTD